MAAVVSAQYYPYPFLPYHNQPAQLPAYLPAPASMPPTTYYIVQAPPPQQVYRTAESAEAGSAPTYSAQPSQGTVSIASAPSPQPIPSGMPFPGPTYIIASNYPFPQNGAVFQGSPYPFPTGGAFFQGGPTLVAPPYEKKQKTRVSSNRILH
uniref:Deleted in azoospermia-associated protein 2 n=1 Tax=Panagrolaimus sp. ES5 TaxID=591445 RepID=A0AC34GWA7_9BILA